MIVDLQSRRLQAQMAVIESLAQEHFPSEVAKQVVEEFEFLLKSVSKDAARVLQRHAFNVHLDDLNLDQEFMSTLAKLLSRRIFEWSGVVISEIILPLISELAMLRAERRGP